MVFFSSRNLPFYFCLCVPPWQKRWKILQKYFFRTMLAIDSKNRQQFCSDAKHFAQICWIWQEYKENILLFPNIQFFLNFAKLASDQENIFLYNFLMAFHNHHFQLPCNEEKKIVFVREAQAPNASTKLRRRTQHLQLIHDQNNGVCNTEKDYKKHVQKKKCSKTKFHQIITCTRDKLVNVNTNTMILPIFRYTVLLRVPTRFIETVEMP